MSPARRSVRGWVGFGRGTGLNKGKAMAHGDVYKPQTLFANSDSRANSCMIEMMQTCGHIKTKPASHVRSL